MSGEGFLSRWSRRKREQDAAATQEAPRPDQPPSQVSPAPARPPLDAEQSPDRLPTEAPGRTVDPADAPVDPADLPDIETMDVTNDLTPWLKRNVPDSWKQAALRKLWQTDPHVRAHVPFADYAWDWNTPGGVPGSGPLGPLDDVTKMAADILRGYGNPEPDGHSAAITEPERVNRGEMSHMRQPDDEQHPASIVDGRGVGSADAATPQTVAVVQPADEPAQLPVLQAVRRSSEPVGSGHEPLPSPPALALQQSDDARDKPHRRRHGGALPD